MKPTRRSAGAAKQPVVKPTRRSAGDPSRLNRVASRRSSLRFGRNTPGIPPSRALSAGRLAGLGAHVGTGCSPRRSLIVAFRSEYTRYSSLTRLVSRTPTGRTGPRRPRRSRGFHHRLFTAPLRVAHRWASARYSPLARPVSRAPRRPRRSRHFVERLPVVECASCAFGFPLVSPRYRSAF